jgi:hypothetical protein
MHNRILRGMMNDEQRTGAIEAFREAIKAADGQVNLGMVLGCSQSRVSRILAGDSDIEAEMAARIEQRWKIPRYRLRPDLWDEPPAEKAKRIRAAKRGAKKKRAA